MRYANRAFTLLELIVVIGLIAVLAGLLLPAIQMARESARQAQCKNHLRQISLGFLSYESAKGRYPPGYLGFLQVAENPHVIFRREGSLAGHLLHILPYLELGTLDADLRQSPVSPFQPHAERWWETGYSSVIQTSRISVFECPSLPVGTANSRVYATEPWDSGYIYYYDPAPPVDAAFTTYLGNGGINGRQIGTPPDKLGMFHVNSQVRTKDVTDGTSNTFLIGEVRGGGDEAEGHRIPRALSYPANGPAKTRTGFWELPEPFSSSPHGISDYGSFHSGGVVPMGFVDGSVRTLAGTTDAVIVRALSTIAGQEIVTD